MRLAPRSSAVLVAALLALGVSTGAAGSTRTWNFRVSLDGKDIGYHRLTVDTNGEERDVSGEARFDVKVLGFVGYRYRHRVAEHWRGDCLASLKSTTDENGKRTTVTVTPAQGGLVVSTGNRRETLDGCVMSFAYWNPAMLHQTHLLNAQTGRLELVHVAQKEDEDLMVRGTLARLTHYHLSGPEHPLDLWYLPGDQWVALDSVVAGGRHLAYRLE